MWHGFLPHFHKTSRYTLGLKIDTLFLEVIECILGAAFLPKQQKLPLLQKAAIKIDVLKFFLQLSWEIKALDTKHYAILSEKLEEVGKMVGGWHRQTANK